MIYILWPTIRPKLFLKSHKVWIDRSNNSDIITTHVCVDNIKDSEIVKTGLFEKDKVIVFKSKNIGVCAPSYTLSSDLIAEDGDIIILASDYFIPPHDWPNILIEKLGGKEGCLMVNDGYQKPDSSNMQYPCVTIPIMTYSCLLKLNKIIYNPSYNHMFSDAELYMNLKDLNLLIDNRKVDETIFEHVHWVTGKRKADQADQSYNLKWKEDEMMWNSRKSLPVEKRIEVNI